MQEHRADGCDAVHARVLPLHMEPACRGHTVTPMPRPHSLTQEGAAGLEGAPLEAAAAGFDAQRDIFARVCCNALLRGYSTAGQWGRALSVLTSMLECAPHKLTPLRVCLLYTSPSPRD